MYDPILCMNVPDTVKSKDERTVDGPRYEKFKRDYEEAKKEVEKAHAEMRKNTRIYNGKEITPKEYIEKFNKAVNKANNLQYILAHMDTHDALDNAIRNCEG